MSPELRTVPLKLSTPSGPTPFNGQFCEMVMRGVVKSGQVAEALSETGDDEHASLPVAVTVLLTEHASAGAVKLALKLAEAPGASVGTFKTMAGVL